MANITSTSRSKFGSSTHLKLQRRHTLLVLLILWIAVWLTPSSGQANTSLTARPDTSSLATNSFLTPLVERELAKAPAEGNALEIIYRNHVRSLNEAATFFYSGLFLRLSLAEQRRLLDTALNLDPRSFYDQTLFLPMALREEYRWRAEVAVQNRVIEKLNGLSLFDQILLYLPPQEGNRTGAAGKAAFNREGQVRRLLRDPLLGNLAEIDNRQVAEIAGPFLSAAELLETKVLLARHLSSRRQASGRANLLAAWDEILRARRELQHTALFQDRRVVLAAGRERPDEKNIFGKNSSLEILATKTPRTLELLRSDEKGSLQRLAAAIADPSALTLIFETHGRADALEFAGTLRPEELAELFANRKKDDDPGQTIVILNTCFGHDYARVFAAALRRRGTPLPILIVPEELGQATLIGRQENTFTRDELGLGGQEGSGTLHALWQGARRETAVYVELGAALIQIR